MTSRYSGSSGGSEERLQFIVDLVAGDTSGLAQIQQLENRLRETGQSLHGAFAKSAKDSFDAFAQAGRVAEGPVNQLNSSMRNLDDTFNRSNTGISRWIINAGNIHGMFSNMQGAMANLNPAFQVLGESIQEIGFGFAGIAMGGTAALLGVANVAASAFKTFTDLGKASGEFYNDLRVGAAVMGMTEVQTMELRSAMELSGANVGQLQIFVQRLTKAMEDLQSGTDNTASRALRKFGVEIEDSNGKLRTSYDVLLDVQRAWAGMSNEQERNALTAELAGMRSREVNALLNDMGTTIPKVQGLLEAHGGIFEDVAKKQEAYNFEMLRMKIQWIELTTGVGQSYVAMLKEINDTVDSAVVVYGRVAPAVSLVGRAFVDAARGQIPFIQNLEIIQRLGENLRWLFPASASTSTAGFAGTPEGDYVDRRFGSVTTPPTSKRVTQPWELDSSERGSAPYDIDKFDKPGAKPPATGYSGLMAQQLDLPAAIAGFREFAHGPFPEFVFQTERGKVAIQAWTMANKEWDDVMSKVRLAELRARIAVDDMRMAGDHTSQAFLDMQARIVGLGEAERYLNMKRHESLDGYAADIEALKQKMQSARQVTRALVIDIQGPSTLTGRMQLAQQGAGADYEMRSGSRNGPVIQFNNHGVVTTADVQEWFTSKLMDTQRLGRTQLSGT